MVDNVGAAIGFYTAFLDFDLLTSFPTFGDVTRGNLRLLLGGPVSTAAQPMPDGAQPKPGGRNRIHLVVDDIEAKADRLRALGANFRNEIIEGPGGRQILLPDPSDSVA
ncbi:MAG: VOC family protein [Hyphomonadaceae bacterium]|nr:VOC family protein [Hyphomonadaceae bacterium]